VDAAIEARALLVVPIDAAAGFVAAAETGAPVLAAATLLAHDLDDAHTVHVELALYLFGDGARIVDDARAGGMQVRRRDGLVVHAQQSARRDVRAVAPVGAHAEEIHSVMVVAGPVHEGRGIVRAVVGEGRDMRGDGIAESVKNVVAVAARQRHGILEVLGHRVEVQLERAMARRSVRTPLAIALPAVTLRIRGRRRRGGDRGQRRGTGGAAEHFASRQAFGDDRIEAGIAGGVGVCIIVRV
jgi:hypothetical protein